jgi:phage head maturation protease
LSEIKLWEVSLVTFPALEQAQITEAKEVTPEQPGADIDRKADKREPLDSTLAEIMEILKRWTN